jgi:hypothetical protein
MNQRKKTKLVQEGHYVAEVEVSLVDDDTGWSPYLSVDDACKLDNAREALRKGDLKSAAKYGKVFELKPVGKVTKSHWTLTKSAACRSIHIDKPGIRRKKPV